MMMNVGNLLRIAWTTEKADHSQEELRAAIASQQVDLNCESITS